jgi:hypothetical protein
MASKPSLAKLRISVFIVDSCGSSSSLSNPSYIAEALTTSAAITSSVRCANEALKGTASIELRVNNNTELGNNVIHQYSRTTVNITLNVIHVPSLSEPSSMQKGSSTFIKPVCLLLKYVLNCEQDFSYLLIQIIRHLD